MPTDLAALIAQGERRGVEFKGPGPLGNNVLTMKVVRAILSMANRRDGGLVIIGVDEASKKYVPTGINAADLATWNYDAVRDKLSAYADPFASVDLEAIHIQGRDFVGIHVDEFVDIPVLCKKGYSYKDPQASGGTPPKDKEVLREGACYVRSHRKPESAEIPTQTEMRDLLDLATDKGVRKFVERALSNKLIIVGQIARDPDDALFDKQLATP